MERHRYSSTTEPDFRINLVQSNNLVRREIENIVDGMADGWDNTTKIMIECEHITVEARPCYLLMHDAVAHNYSYLCMDKLPYGGYFKCLKKIRTNGVNYAVSVEDFARAYGYAKCLEQHMPPVSTQREQLSKSENSKGKARGKNKFIEDEESGSTWQ